MALNDNDLFNNPMVNSAAAAMSSEQKDEYAKIGEKIYETTDFETNKILNNMPDPMVDSILHLTVQLRSGLHPIDLSNEDIDLLKEAYGDKWYEKWGYEEKDLKSY